MSYTQKPEDAQMFTNVFVKPSAYDYYLAKRQVADKTMFVLEIYGSTSKGSINRHGSYQKDFMGLDVEVERAKRGSPTSGRISISMASKRLPAQSLRARNACWKCHEQNAAVEHSFVQFIQLLDVARAKNTINPRCIWNSKPHAPYYSSWKWPKRLLSDSAKVGCRKYGFAQDGVRQLPHHGQLQLSHDLAAFDSQDGRPEDLVGFRVYDRLHESRVSATSSARAT